MARLYRNSVIYSSSRDLEHWLEIELFRKITSAPNLPTLQDLPYGMLAGLGPENQPPLRFSFPVVGNGKFAKTSWATFCDPGTSRRTEQISSIRPNDYSWWNVRRIPECTWLNRFRTECASVIKLVGSVSGDWGLTPYQSCDWGGDVQTHN